MKPSWAHLGSISGLVGGMLRQVGSNMGSDGHKIRLLRDFLAYLQGVQHHIDFWGGFGTEATEP